MTTKRKRPSYIPADLLTISEWRQQGLVPREGEQPRATFNRGSGGPKKYFHRDQLRPIGKPKAKRASLLPAESFRLPDTSTHVVTGRDASGKIVASERADRRQCERTAQEWRASGLVVEIQPINQ